VSSTEIEQLTRSRDNALKNMDQWKHEANTLRSENERLRAALEWYAKADYDQRICNDGDGYTDVWGGEEILEDKGKRAREALRDAATTPTDKD
jgi:hypothetical protein